MKKRSDDITINISSILRKLKSNWLVIVLLGIIAYLAYPKLSDTSALSILGELESSLISTDACSFEDKVKEKIINEYLIFAFTQDGINIDGNVTVTVTNLSPEYGFAISQIGMRHTNVFGNDKQYHNPSTSLLLEPEQSETFDVSFPRGRKTYLRPYSILDQTKIRCE